MAVTSFPAERSWPVRGSRWIEVRGPAKRSMLEDDDDADDDVE